MRFAFSTNAFRQYSLSDAMRIVADAGYHGVEIMADVPHAYPLHLGSSDIHAIRRTLDDCGLEISNINAFMHHADGDTYHPSWIEKEPELRAKRVDYTLRCIDLAAELGARHLSTEPGGPLQDMTREEGLELFREGLRQVEERAWVRNVRILIEPEPGLLIENSEQFLELFQNLDPAVFGLNFDIGHFFCVGEDPAARVRDLQAVAHHYHLEDIAPSREHHHLMLGHGAVDIPGVLDTIDGTGYDGFVTVELYTYEDRPIEAVRNAMEYLMAWKGRP
ncbi:MAG: sugar phosphate isomerase/epimerase [Syntrophobacteraceae bacterium]|nr:sugar phosphate isomerase/epimerase [Syntrophobacteraceae bacterium]